MRIIFFLAVALALSPVSGDYPTMIREARNCFETGRFEECDSLLTELRGLKLKRLQRRKVCTLWLDNTYRSGHHEAFLDALQSKYVKKNLDRTDYEYWSNVSRIPPMEVVWPEETERLPLKTIGPQGRSLYGVDVSVNGKPLVGMIDNCWSDYCGMSTELAEQLGVRPIGKTININGNKKAKAYIGVVDSLSFGGLVVRNVLVDVSDHVKSVQAQLPFDIVIGGNVLREVGDLVIDNEEGTVSFSKETLDIPRNLSWAYDAHNYYVDGTVDGKPVTLLLDMGATNTHLNKKILDRFPADSAYVEGTQTTIMADRTWKTKVYVIRKAHLAFAGAECEVPDVVIKLEDYGGSRSEGSVGVDALLPFKSLVFNARKLYLQLNR